MDAQAFRIWLLSACPLSPETPGVDVPEISKPLEALQTVAAWAVGYIRLQNRLPKPLNSQAMPV
jgi:hypothetical protein